MQKIITKIDHQDHRGMIVDLIENETLNAVTFISMTPGAVRGNHYHKETTQWNYIVKGRIKVVAQVGDGPVNELILEKGDLSVTLPLEKHAFVGMEDAEMLVFTKGPRGGKEYESDTFRLEIPLV